MRLLTANDIEDEDEDDRRGEGSIDQSLQMRNSSVSKRSIDQANQHRYDRAAFPYRMQKMFWLYRYSSGPSPPQSSSYSVSFPHYGPTLFPHQKNQGPGESLPQKRDFS
jgi:hypothetical protein